jgi:hypothetical protein
MAVLDRPTVRAENGSLHFEVNLSGRSHPKEVSSAGMQRGPEENQNLDD